MRDYSCDITLATLLYSPGGRGTREPRPHTLQDTLLDEDTLLVRYTSSYCTGLVAEADEIGLPRVLLPSRRLLNLVPHCRWPRLFAATLIPHTDDTRLRDFYNNCTNSILRQLETKSGKLQMHCSEFHQ